VVHGNGKKLIICRWTTLQAFIAFRSTQIYFHIYFFLNLYYKERCTVYFIYILSTSESYKDYIFAITKEINHELSEGRYYPQNSASEIVFDI